jgi:hypothetical protein
MINAAIASAAKSGAKARGSWFASRRRRTAEKKAVLDNMRRESGHMAAAKEDGRTKATE